MGTADFFLSSATVQLRLVGALNRKGESLQIGLPLGEIAYALRHLSGRDSNNFVKKGCSQPDEGYCRG
jgi:hypothetical protein